MAANMKAVKLRMKSIQSTMQITKAMELVASSKLRKAKERADASRPYFHTLENTLKQIAAGNTDLSSVYTKKSKSEKWCYVVIAGDRGLAGGYNSNLFKEMESETAGKDYCAFKAGEFGHAALGYTNFVSMLSQKPDVSSMLPLEDLSGEEKDMKQIHSLILYEPDSETVFDAIVPEYLAGMVYGAMCESVASELAARRTAMDAASKNAGEMIEQLSLYYNRARQASITQEITEIVAGAEEP